MSTFHQFQKDLKLYFQAPSMMTSFNVPSQLILTSDQCPCLWVVFSPSVCDISWFLCGS